MEKTKKNVFADIRLLAELGTQFTVWQVRVVKQKNGGIHQKNYDLFQPFVDKKRTLPVHNATVTATPKTFSVEGGLQTYTEYTINLPTLQPTTSAA